ncbi:Protein NRT1/ PTR FAMILY 3.1 [Senna tora]|uniref:Protein NRT1/ PTR FAMILY 3.1 n=1 Tax=Senna tora TaxID=362788 RepID=A0A834TTI4_9FABA|nr:Protein NRT1/ PTR FAMILY 3.1 [Senna tora]
MSWWSASGRSRRIAPLRRRPRRAGSRPTRAPRGGGTRIGLPAVPHWPLGRAPLLRRVGALDNGSSSDSPELSSIRIGNEGTKKRRQA